MRINIDKITVKKRIRKEVARIDGLAADIAENGLLNPVTVMALSGTNGNNGEGYQLLAGLRRLRAVQSLGWTEIMVNVVKPADAEQALRMEISENEQRESFTFSEKIEFARLLEEIENAKAKERMSIYGKIGGKGGAKSVDSDGDSKGGDTCPTPSTGRSRDAIGDIVGMSGRTLERGKYIAENASDEVIAELDAGKRTIGGTYKELKAKEKAENAKAEPSKPIGLPKRDQPAEIAVPTLPAKTEKIETADNAAVVSDVADTENTEPSATEENADNVARFDVNENAESEDSLAEETAYAEPEEPASTIATTPHTEASAPAEQTPEKPKKPTAAQRREERQMAALSPRERAAILSRKAFNEMTDGEKIADLTRRLDDERFRADKAEQELARHKDLLHNAIVHRDATINNQQGQIDWFTAENARLKAALEAANAKITELEGREHNA